MDVDSNLASSTAAVDDSKGAPDTEERSTELETSRSSLDSGTAARKSADIGVTEPLPTSSDEVDETASKLEEASQSLSDSQQTEVADPRASVDSGRKSLDIQPATGTEVDMVESQRQDEIHGYIERIDALQSKLKYLAKEAAESAKSAAAEASPGSAKKQLLEKDEKIALLLEEGQKLSKSELDQRMVIKKLRQQINENTKSQIEMKKKTEMLERNLVSSEAKLKRVEASEKRATESLSTQTKNTKDLEAVTNERNALSQTVQDMKGQLGRAVARAEAAETKAQSDAAEQHKRRVEDLEEELSSIKIERDIGEEKARKEIDELKEKIEREKERARMLETELKGEQSVLESKMESLRSRAEEASSGVTSETQAKLLRQIETLQTQYTVASDNWHTLEGSLLSRLANVEKERDEVGRREGELRKKIRELVSTTNIVSRYTQWLNRLATESSTKEVGRRGGNFQRERARPGEQAGRACTGAAEIAAKATKGLRRSFGSPTRACRAKEILRCIMGAEARRRARSMARPAEQPATASGNVTSPFYSEAEQSRCYAGWSLRFATRQSAILDAAWFA